MVSGGLFDFRVHASISRQDSSLRTQGLGSVLKFGESASPDVHCPKGSSWSVTMESGRKNHTIHGS